ncbi:MAG: hypothetical protein HY907_18920 [Deltaproteobacteria bacterium]|nr:hypothetical protein [Deltaproteobacteria bacterium]
MRTTRHSIVGSPGREETEGGESDEDRDPDDTRVYNMKGRAGGRGAPLELMVIKRRGVSHTDSAVTWVAVEIWTRNRIYLIDGTMRCIGVVDRATNRRGEDHSLLGATLTGGQRRTSAHIELSQPFPLPGMNAIFRHRAASRGIHPFGETSPVERVILRLGLTTVDVDALGEAHHELTARFFLNPR